MRLAVAFAIFIAASPAAAELYRWIDPDSGSIKFSNYPPPWYGDPEKEKRAPKVEVIPAASRTPAPTAAPAVPAAQKMEGLASLEQRFRSILQSLTVSPAGGDVNRAGAGLQQQLEAYKAAAAELDRADPKGAERRRAEAQPLLDRLLPPLRPQFEGKPPAPPAR